MSKYIVIIMYNPDDYSPAHPSLERLLYGSAHTARAVRKREKLNKLVKCIRLHMAKGRYVIVRGWEQAVEMAWNETAVLSFKGPLEQHVEYQGEQHAHFIEYRAEIALADSEQRVKAIKSSDATVGVHKHSTMSEFVRMGRECADVCANLLDSAATHGECPPFIP